MDKYPNNLSNLKEKTEKKNWLSSQLFGKRFHSDQTLYEYLIEFLLVFSSAKNSDMVTGKMKFHDMSNYSDEDELKYWFEPKMALRRFIFFDKAKKKDLIKEDEEAYIEMLELIKDKMREMTEEEKNEIVGGIQDLFHGYAVVLKKRSWSAQALLPICKEFVVCGCDPSVKKRKKKLTSTDVKPEDIDMSFEFSNRNFLARGGEVYYLHLLQGLENKPEKKERLEFLLTDLLEVQCKKISELANAIQMIWEEGKNFEKKNLNKNLTIAYIPKDAYLECENYAIDELINYLACEMHPINRTEILAKGVMFQIMRMMNCCVNKYLKIGKPIWIVDMKAKNNNTVKKIAADSYNDIEDNFVAALNKKAKELNISDADIVKAVADAKKQSIAIFKSKGKEMQCIIPSKGAFERFSLSEDIIRFLVLSIIEPKKKMTLSMFLEKMYEHYGIVIGPNEYRKSLENDDMLEKLLANSFVENENEFQRVLSEIGFLRELSDATSIVENPYMSLKGEKI